MGITSNTVPWELISAAGMFPVMLRSLETATPAADEYMEESVFQPRIRSIFDQIVSRKWPLRAVIIPRTSEQEYKLFLYLREVSRQDSSGKSTPVYLYDLPHYRSVESEAYGLSVTVDLKGKIEEISGRALSEEQIAIAVSESNAARAAVRSLICLRNASPRVSGTLALALIGPFWLMQRKIYAERVTEATAILKDFSSLPGPRILIKGVSLDDSRLHRLLESCGAVVVSEDDWWGERSAGEDVPELSDPITACFEKYYADSPSPRILPSSFADSWFESRSHNGIEGVIFYLPADDYVAGWDYPRQKQFLDAGGIPNLLIRSDPAQIDSKENARIREWIQQLPTKT